jgi:aconitate hydratase 2/2-methylisocitrate dehydratase
VYLASAELSAVAAVMGRLPSIAEYLDIAKNLDMVADDIYKYLNFNELPKYQNAADSVVLEAS